jgi:hypothetical protein
MDLAMSALLSEADIRAGLQDVCFVPKAEAAPLLLRSRELIVFGRYRKMVHVATRASLRRPSTSIAKPRSKLCTTQLLGRTLGIRPRPSRSECLSREA